MASVQWSRTGEQEQINMDRARVDLRGQGQHVLILDNPKQVLTSDSLYPRVVILLLSSVTWGNISVLLTILRVGCRQPSVLVVSRNQGIIFIKCLQIIPSLLQRQISLQKTS